MPNSLSTTLRNQLRSVTLDAREAAEKACRAALENLAAHEADYRPHMKIEQRQLRNRLRARGRALGDERDRKANAQSIRHLTEDAAYEHWHRLLFTRFLTENGLLVTDEENGNVEVTLEDCEELAPELGARDGFDLACRFASETLPGVFRTGDPILELPLAANNQVELRRLLESIPAEVFKTDDALGWTYQFWQEERKKEVNESGEKIGADQLSPVTQLFTEDYMVEFLLHNTLGAWWAGKLGPITAATEEEARAKAALPAREGIAATGITWTYLRFVKVEPDTDDNSALRTPNSALPTWSPAAGTFDGWPVEAKDVTFLDPCMGSGHFPVFALPILGRLRMEEENLTAQEAVHAVLRDNIHGLELDPRCCQIGAFNLALTAWKLGGYQALPPLNVACCGLAPQAKKEDWLELAGDSDKLRRGMEKLYDLFKRAPVLGSLINPRLGGGDLLEAGFEELQPLLEEAMDDEATQELAVTAQGIAKAAELLAGQFTLVATNVPYLGQKKQDRELKDYCERVHPEAKADLATCFVERCLQFCSSGGSTTLVVPQHWFFLGTYKKLRKRLLEGYSWDCVVRLGSGAFETITGEIVNVNLVGITRHAPSVSTTFSGLDAAEVKSVAEKATATISRELTLLDQLKQLRNPDARVSLEDIADLPLLDTHAESLVGIQTGDYPRFITCLWERPRCSSDWEFYSRPPDSADTAVQCSETVLWENGNGQLLRFVQERLGVGSEAAWLRGEPCWGNLGVAVQLMRGLSASLYTGQKFDQMLAVLLPNKTQHLGAIWAFCSSPEFSKSVRMVDQSLKVTNATIAKVPFDLEHWQKVAAEKYPDGLPKPHSDDPTQWLFNGHPQGSEQPLHVAVSRLLGYRWPRQTGSSFPDCPAIDEPDGLEQFADEDGIVCLAALNRELPAAARLRTLLAAALGSYDERALIKATGSSKTNLEDWLRDDFFKGHTTLFHKRPFIWHLWDGLPDGFHVLINYHKLDEATLKKLTYTYLGDWIRDQKGAAAEDKPGAAERLGAATALQQKLVAILEGEAPLDIFVRWKPIKEQAIGWNPDLNDGVRLNIRPFLLAGDVKLKGAGLFRLKPGIEFKPKPDRGKEPQREKADYPWFWCDKDPATDPEGGKDFTGKRWNTVHLSLANKKRSPLVKLSNLHVRNYRGLRDISIPLSSFVCITGENNAGKSSVLQALSLFLSGSSLKNTDYFNEDEELVIEVEVSEITVADLLLHADEHRDRIESILEDEKMTLVRRYGTDGKSQLGLYTMVPKEERFEDDNVSVLLKGTKGKAIAEAALSVFPELAEQAAEMTTQGNTKELIEKLADGLPDAQKELQFRPLPTGMDKSVLPMLPERIYIPAVKDFSDETKTAESSSFGKILSIVMKSIEPLLAQEADLFDRLSKKLTRVLDPEGGILDERLPLIKTIEATIQRYVRESFSNVSLEIEIPPPELKTVLSTARILADDGVQGPLELKGDGLRRAVVFSILRSYVELARTAQNDGETVEGQAERGYILLFEEPELFLHPEAQKILFDALGVFSEKHQVVVTTHSPLFLSPKALATFIRLSKANIDGVPKPSTRALHVDLTGVKPKDEFQIICYENNSAAFFSKRVVLVEGDSDYIAFPHIAETLNPDWNCRVHSVAFVRVGGKGSIARYRDFFDIFEIPIFVIADLDTVIDGFEKLGPSEAAKVIHGELIQAINSSIEAADEPPTPKTDDIKKAQGQPGVKALWDDVREAKREFDADPGKFDDLDAAMKEFFAWERKNLRQDCLTEAACPEVKRLKLALIWALRKAGTFILERGALDDYYPENLPGGNSDKPHRAQQFIAAHDTRDKALSIEFRTD